MTNIHITQACVLRGAVIGCIAFALATPVVQAQGAYDGVVVFGTSLSDTGNAFVLWGEASTAPDYQLDPLLVPSAPYARGGHHFTNGRTWVEQLAGSLGHAGNVRPAFLAEGPVATNYAVAAARARDDGKNFNLTAQVDAFLEASGGIASPNALYVIEMGGNDIRDALVAYPNGHTLVIKEALQAIAVNVGRLYASGREAVPHLARTQPRAHSGHPIPEQRHAWHRAARHGPGDGLQRRSGWHRRAMDASSRDPHRQARCLRAAQRDRRQRRDLRPEQRDGGVHHARDCAVRVRHAQRVPVLGRHPPDHRGARHHRDRGRFGAAR